MFVSVTRLRIRGWRFIPAFAVQALRSAREAKAASGNVAVTLLAEAHRTFWTRTVWTDEAAMRAFMVAPAHRRAMGRLAEWCDEAAVVHWTQDTPEPPSWENVQQRMQHEGRPSKVSHPTPAHSNFEIAAPRIGRFSELRFK
jgi:hypothetical protein